jgi:mannose-6-phosphate isomerase-like protein (cupin superfamily)
MKPAILRFEIEREYFTDERCHINELSNHDGDADVSVAQARVAPGVRTRLHRLRNTVERYVILTGEGLVEVGDLEPATVTKGDVVLIPPMCPQRITNTGEGDLLFLAICSPRFRQENYEDIESA